MNRFESVTKPLTWFMALLLAAFLAGCGSTDGTPTVNDITAPTVSSVVPANATTGIPLNASITAIFSEAMDPLTLTTSTFTLKQGSTVVPGAVTYLGVTATLKPTSNLAASTVYTVAITTGVKDLAGNALAVTKTWTFTTGLTADVTPPTVVSTVPVNATTGIAINASVTAIFSELMNPATIISPATSFTLTGPGTAAVAGVVTYAGSTATFKPTSNLAVSTVYTATLKTGVTDLAGNAMVANKTWSFTTGAAADTTPPTVSSTVPADLGVNVVITAPLTVTFSELMDPAALNASPSVAFTLAGPGTTPVPGAVTYTTGMTATFTPTSTLVAGTLYTATISTAVKDLAGNTMVAAKTWSFTTAAAVSNTVLPGIAGSAGANATNPTVNTANPSNLDVNVPTSTRGDLHTNLVGVKLVVATFDEPMDPTTIVSAIPGAVSTFTLKDMTVGTGSIVSGTVAMNAANTVATFTPAANLTPGTNYTATITTAAKNAGSIKAMPKSVAWSFMTRAASSVNQANPFVGQAPIDLLTAGNFVILAGSGITDVTPSIITGNIGVSTTTGASITVPCADMVGTSKVYDVDGTYAGGAATCAMYGPGANKTTVDNAVLDKGTAYGEAAGRTIPDAINLGAAEIGGKTFYPGLYQYSGASTISTNVTLDAQGDTNAVWIFQIAGDLTVPNSGILPGIQVLLTNGAKASNVFWQVAASSFGATIGTYNTFNGNILSSAQARAFTGAVVNGRLFAATGVVLQQNPVTQPAP